MEAGMNGASPRKICGQVFVVAAAAMAILTNDKKYNKITHGFYRARNTKGSRFSSRPFVYSW
jgi:hypothetical protein